MNRLFLIINLLLSVLCAHQFSYAMKSEVVSFDKFDQVIPEVQLKIFAYSDNQTSFQHTNRTYAALFSTKNPAIFSKDFCEIMYEKKRGVQRMCAILFCAAYYRHNPVEIRNILANSGILDRCDNRMPIFYYTDTYTHCSNTLADLHGIAAVRLNLELLHILREYNIPEPEMRSYPNVFDMCCIEGDSKILTNFGKQSQTWHKIVNLLIDFDYGTCLTRFLANPKKHVVPDIHKMHLARAFDNKSTMALRALLTHLLTIRYPLKKVNQITNYLDFLDLEDADSVNYFLNLHQIVPLQ